MCIILNPIKVDTPFFSHNGCRIVCFAVLRFSSSEVRTLNLKSKGNDFTVNTFKSEILSNYYRSIIESIFRMNLLERKTADFKKFKYHVLQCKILDFGILRSKYIKSGTQNCKIMQKVTTIM